MALEKSRFFDSVGDDRTYQAEQFAEYFRMFLSDGIRNAGTNLEVRASGAGLSVQVDYGMAMIQGYAYWLEDDRAGKMLLQLAAASTLPRIDRIVLRLNKSLQERTIRLAVLGGTPAANPQAPQLTRTGNIYEISLAQVNIAGNATTITDNNITDERLTEHCGLINSLIDLDSANFDRKANVILHNLKNQGYMPLTGGNFSGAVGMGAHRISNVGSPQADGDAVNKKHADATYVAKTGQAADSAKLGGKAPTQYATSAQGTKADNALPKSSYTAADVLTKIKGVDGSGSGLDADTVDGRHAHDFATSAQGVKADNALPKSSYTAADVLAKIKSVDGAGSGLDADLLDGVDGSGYLRKNGANQNLGTIPVVQGQSDTGGSRIIFTDGTGNIKHLIGSNNGAEALKITNLGTGGIDLVANGAHMITFVASAGMSLNGKRIPNYSIGTSDPPGTLALGEIYFKV